MRILRSRLADFCRAHSIEILYAFGSRARAALDSLDDVRSGFESAGSDLDIGAKVSVDSRVDVREKAVIAVGLEDLFGVSRVDLVLLHEADPFLAANVIRGERLYSVDAHAADEYELYVLRRAGDCAPLERERLALLEES